MKLSFSLRTLVGSKTSRLSLSIKRREVQWARSDYKLKTMLATKEISMDAAAVVAVLSELGGIFTLKGTSNGIEGFSQWTALFHLTLYWLWQELCETLWCKIG